MLKKDRGFTLLEIVLTLGILTLILSLGLGIVSTVQKTTARQEAKNLELILQTAARRARDGVNSSNWGVYIPYDEETRRAREIIIFSGTSYITRDSTYDIVYPLSSEINFTSFKNSPASLGNDHEIVFSYLTGQISAASSLVVDFFGETLTISFSVSGLPVL